jgi:hypothetical protein
MPQPFQFGSNSPGTGAQTGGYNQALGDLNKSLQSSQQTTQAGQMQLGQQLQQNQANVGQNLTNRGLGNTTMANTMQQAPQQTYNLGMAQLSDLGNMRQMGAYNNLANMTAQGGNAITQTAQPYAQSNFMKQQMGQGQQQIPNAPPAPTMGMGGAMGGPGGAAGGGGQQGPMNMSNYQNLMNMQQYGSGGGYLGPGQAGSLNPNQGYGGVTDPNMMQPQDPYADLGSDQG